LASGYFAQVELAIDRMMVVLPKGVGRKFSRGVKGKKYRKLAKNTKK